ncbi:MAG TPA: glycosyltransferase family 39 protein [Gemmatimonadaceae bacterium]|nr:glycosyltransferase family 39 protein [Gemmatimonadaceae bacterium]
MVLTPSRAQPRSAEGTAAWLGVILAAGLLLRIGLLPFRWINPDEGAHLMDGQLILHGLVPLVDFQSRQPLYAYLQAGILALFPGNYFVARLLPVLAIMGTAVFVFLIARRLFNERVALLATAIYVFHPLVIIWSPIVKTEPLTAFLCSIAVYGTVRFMQRMGERGEGWLWLVLAGAMLGIAFYVRQSSLAVTAALVVFLLAALWSRPQRLARAYGALIVGGLLIVALAVAWYSRYMTAAELWGSSLNPFGLAISAVGTFIAAPVSGPPGDHDVLRLSVQSWTTTLGAVRETIALDAFLFAGLVVAAVIVVYLRIRRPIELRRYWQPLVLLYCWSLALMLAYAYWAIHRGYFTQYFTETVPPLAILLAFSLWYLSGIVASASPSVGRAIALGAGLAAVFVFYRVRPATEVPHTALVLVLALLVVLAYARATRWSRWAAMLGVAVVAIIASGAVGSSAPHHLSTVAKLLITLAGVIVVVFLASVRWIERAAYVGLILIVATFISAFTAAGRAMTVAYECVWSPRTVANVTRYIDAHSGPRDQVMSGAMIWAVTAQRPPFMMISHPLAYDRGAPPDVAARMRAALDSAPPRLIVVDGYTGRTFLSYLDPDGQLLATRYALEQTFPGSRYPVQVYALKRTVVTRR